MPRFSAQPAGRVQPATGSAAESDQPTGSDQTGQPTSEPLPEGLSGPQLARAVLDAATRRRARRAHRGRGDGADPGQRFRSRGYSGPGPDPRDPAPFAQVLAKLVQLRGWQRPTAEATLFGDWEKVVGPDIAAHSRPVRLENGELTIEAESTAWATQLRLLARTILTRIGSVVGHNLVTKLRIHGPAAPSWSHGRKRVKGTGPGDTYG